MSITQVLISAGGIYFFYLYYGVLQERIFKPEPNGDRFTFTMTLLTIQCFFNLTLGYAGMLFSGGKGTSKDIKTKANSFSIKSFSATGLFWIQLISLSYLVAMGCSNEALRHVSYPLQALAKSCKMVPVMLASVLIGGARYTLLEYVSVGCITGGVLLFQLAKSKSSSSAMEGNSLFGMVLLFLSLSLDGFTSSNQKLFSKEYKPSGHFLMYQMNLWSTVYLIPLLIVTGEGLVSMEYLISHPALMYDIVLFSICSALGQQFIFYCVVGPGPLVCTTITTTRKFFTVLLSVLMFPENKLNTAQWGSVGLVFAGLGLELFHSLFHRNHPPPVEKHKKAS